MQESKEKLGAVWLWFGMALFGVMGLIMLLHGLGIISADWWNPNPDVPAFIFALIGALLLLSVPLMFAQVWPMPKVITDFAGYAVMALAMIVAHWMIFFAQGGSCSLGGITFALGLPNFICVGMFAGVLAIIDAVAILFAGKALLRWISSTARW